MADMLLGLDLGTTSAKGVLLRVDGQVVAEASSTPYPIAQLKPGWAEQNPEDWWQAACDVIRELCAQVEGGERIAGVAISGQGCACTLVDEQGTVLRPAIIWMDTRATAETATMTARWGDEVLRLNGNGVGAYNTEPKLLWLREHEPEVYARSAYTLTTTAYVTFRLTGKAVMNHADGGILFAYDLARGDWSRSLLEEMGVRPELYPPLYPCAAPIGEVTSSAARDSGLRAGTPVVAGGEDSPAAALSVGVTQAGDAFLSLGTAAVVGVCLPAGHSLGEPRILTYPHVLPDLLIASGSMSSAGAAVEWLAREFGVSYGLQPQNYDGFNRAVEQSPPGANSIIFLPYLAGELHPILDARARGVFFGLSIATRREDIARAVMEGSAMAIRHNLSVASAAGADVKQLYASGGPTRSEPWCQIIADVTGQPLRVVESGGAPVGDALIAGVGAGLIADAGEMARRMVKVEREYAVRTEYRARYDHIYATYVRLYEHLAADFAFMADCP